MQASNQAIQEFLKSVCNEIRSKSVHKFISRELTDHIEDLKNQFLDQGLDEETAVIKAVEEMGDPILVGKQLDQAHRPLTEWSILSLAAILVLAGGLLQFLLSGVSPNNADMFSHFLRYAPVGIVIFVVIYFFDYTLLGRYSKLTYFLLLAAAIAGFSFFKMYNGAHGHVYYFGLLFIPAFAGIIYSFKGRGYIGIIFSGLFYAGAAFLCFLGPSLSALIFLTVSGLFMMTVSIVKGFYGGNKKVSLSILYVPTAIIPLFVLLKIMLTEPYQFRRIISIIVPDNDIRGAGWQYNMIKQLLASSKPMGQTVLEGPLANTPIEKLLPGWTTDFSLTYIIARFGYLAGAILILIMLFLILRMFVSVFKQKNAYGFLLSFSASLAITGQITLYVLCNLGIIAPKAGTLPFISFGAFGFVVNMVLIGILLSVHRRTYLVNDRPRNLQSNERLFTFADGKLIIDLGINRRN